MGPLMTTAACPVLALTKQKKRKERRIQKKGKQNNQHFCITQALMKKGVEQLNNDTETLLKQQNKGVNTCFELEVMK